jgi:hypothetical protein
MISEDALVLTGLASYPIVGKQEVIRLFPIARYSGISALTLRIRVPLSRIAWTGTDAEAATTSD